MSRGTLSPGTPPLGQAALGSGAAGTLCLCLWFQPQVWALCSKAPGEPTWSLSTWQSGSPDTGRCHQIQPSVPLPVRWGNQGIKTEWYQTILSLHSDVSLRPPTKYRMLVLETAQETQRMSLILFSEKRLHVCAEIFAFVRTKESGICLWVSPSSKTLKTGFLLAWSAHTFS